MAHAPETGAINPFHFSGADFRYVCPCVVQISDRILPGGTAEAVPALLKLGDSALGGSHP